MFVPKDWIATYPIGASGLSLGGHSSSLSLSPCSYTCHAGFGLTHDTTSLLPDTLSDMPCSVIRLLCPKPWQQMLIVPFQAHMGGQATW